ncbi:MAG TPA: hypothetical protein DCP85_09085 [Elusimicrobia bacterium]|nr:hypothetical protein [Elusimicrobiota bacterium]
MTEQELRKKALDLCHAVLRAELPLDEFNKQWPVEADAYNFLFKVYEDLEDGVEHAPGCFFRNGVNFDSWRKSNIHWTITLDAELLGSDKPLDMLERCHDSITAKAGMPDVQKAIAEWFKSEEENK